MAVAAVIHDQVLVGEVLARALQHHGYDAHLGGVNDTTSHNEVLGHRPHDRHRPQLVGRVPACRRRHDADPHLGSLTPTIDRVSAGLPGMNAAVQHKYVRTFHGSVASSDRTRPRAQTAARSWSGASSPWRRYRREEPLTCWRIPLMARF